MVKLGFLAEAYHLEPSKFQLYVEEDLIDQSESRKCLYRYIGNVLLFSCSFKLQRLVHSRFRRRNGKDGSNVNSRILN